MTVDKSMPSGPSAEDRAAEARLSAFLSQAGIMVHRHAHPPLHTVEDSRAFRDDLPDTHRGAHTKNLFLKERKDGGLWLVVCLEDRRIRIPDLSRALGAKRFSFGSAELLWETLGVRPGAVSPFALINDTGPHQVRLALDARMMQAEVMNFHPLHNHATLAISNEDMRKFIDACGHAPSLVDFDALEAQAAEREQDRAPEDRGPQAGDMELNDA